jgi:uncharacterized membrane protein YbjE (DUF340 family)
MLVILKGALEGALIMAGLILVDVNHEYWLVILGFTAFFIGISMAMSDIKEDTKREILEEIENND